MAKWGRTARLIVQTCTIVVFSVYIIVHLSECFREYVTKNHKQAIGYLEIFAVGCCGGVYYCYGRGASGGEFRLGLRVRWR